MDILNSSVVSVVQAFRQVLFQVRLEVLVWLSTLKNKWLQMAGLSVSLDTHKTLNYRNQAVKVIIDDDLKTKCTCRVLGPALSVQYLRKTRAQGVIQRCIWKASFS